METFVYVERHQTIICRICKHAVTARQIRRYIMDAPVNCSGTHDAEARQRMVSKFETKEAVNIKDLAIPTTTVVSVDGLEIFTDGLKCDSTERGCWFITRKTDEIKRHCRQVHGWANPHGRGRPRKGVSSIDQPWTANVKCQQFFKTGPKSRLFEVRLPSEEE